MAHQKVSKDFYKILKVTRTATTHDIKTSYRRLALTLHPDRNGGDKQKTIMFREVSEAYAILSDHSKRTTYDMTYGGGSTSSSQRRRPRADYRKVYSPRAPPGFKTFDAKKHYDMHYGNGIMEEEVRRALKRAKEAAGKEVYQSPLGPGFTFDPKSSHNPYSRRSKQGNNNGPEIEIEYEEAFMDTDGLMSAAKRLTITRELIKGRLHKRREVRVERQRSPKKNEAGTNECSVM
eukprot:CAMPEP_0194146344 /NCGR_PEP_ID=MMETSP0152-20130528/20531_1 /TAXON_ID=1049557 /ORGANISM="Thalassiothrix antarctica, Strain L6-D1" /LENGTH=233 /DNA_ID=CAMNT_0038846839 /DNA_START=263 /DNA_END=964 /DNA_ORIENTATION=-